MWVGNQGSRDGDGIPQRVFWGVSIDGELRMDYYQDFWIISTIISAGGFVSENSVGGAPIRHGSPGGA